MQPSNFLKLSHIEQTLGHFCCNVSTYFPARMPKGETGLLEIFALHDSRPRSGFRDQLPSP